MSSEAVTERLREVSRLSREAPPRGVDMSSEAVTARLREMASLSALCLQLQAIGEQSAALSGQASVAASVPPGSPLG